MWFEKKPIVICKKKKEYIKYIYLNYIYYQRVAITANLSVLNLLWKNEINKLVP